LTWNRGNNISPTWICDENNDKLTIETSDIETTYDEENDVDVCNICKYDITCCECCEIWVYSDGYGECDCVGVAKNGSEAYKLAEEFMKEHPKGWFEPAIKVKQKEEFIFR